MNFANNRLFKIVYLAKKAFFEYKWQIVLLTALGLIGASLEGIGVNALIPLFSFAIEDGQTSNNLISQLTKGFFNFFNLNFNVSFLLFFIITLFILKALINLFIAFIKINITSDYEAKTRSRLFTKILNSSWPHLLKQKSGHLEIILMLDVPASSSLLEQISGAIIVFGSLLIYIIVALNISLPITLITIILGAILFLTIKPVIYKTKKVAYERTQANKEIGHHISENLSGIKAVKVLAAEMGIITRANDYFEKLKKLWVRSLMLKTLSAVFIEPLSLIFICLVFIFNYSSPNFNLAVLIAIVYLIHRIFIYFQQLQRNLQTILDLFPHLQSIIKYEGQAIDNFERNGGDKKFAFNQNLKFENVDFAYFENKPILNNLNLKINKGEMIGLIGPSGSGKTTLVDLILRLFQPSAGKIYLDGIDISEINLKEWRDHVGYVSQELFLINDTVANNIRFYNKILIDQDIAEAAKMANIYEFIQTLPNKFETIIGERGILISAGQRQRIVIARILARKPQLLILDEATSALDNKSEAKIQKVIENLKGKITVLIIAHRLSTITDADKLLVLDNGGIIEQGTPADLLKDKNTYFYKVYNITA